MPDWNYSQGKVRAAFATDRVEKQTMRRNNSSKARLLSRYRAGLAAAMFLCVFLAVPSETRPAGRSIGLSPVQDLSFGTLGVGNIAGTATVDTAGGKTVSAGVIDLGGIATAAVFDVTGEKNMAFSIVILTPSVTLQAGAIPGPLLSNFQISPSPFGVLNNTGKATISIGASLSLSPSLAEASYGGTFDIMISYQ